MELFAIAKLMPQCKKAIMECLAPVTTKNLRPVVVFIAINFVEFLFHSPYCIVKRETDNLWLPKYLGLLNARRTLPFQRFMLQTYS